MTEAITIQESARLIELEDIIERGVKTFIHVGEALAEIRDKRLYRIQYETFEAYCKDEWEISRQSAYDLIATSKVAANVQEVGQITREQARPLAALKEPAQQREALASATKASGGNPTVTHVEAAVEEIKNKVNRLDPAQARSLPEIQLSKEGQAAVEQAGKDSETLWSLKFHWKKATKKERAAFREFIAD